MKNNNTTRKTLFIITILVLTLIVSLSSFAWYQVGNLRQSSVTVQANDGYVYHVEDVAASDILFANMGGVDSQSINGGKIITQGSTSYNTADGTINYANLDVNFVVQNTAVNKIFSFKISDVRAYSQLTTVTVNDTVADGVHSGNFTYDGTTYYYQGTTVYNDAKHEEINEDYAIEGDLLYSKAEAYLVDQLKSELIFQFYTDGTTTIYTDANCNTQKTTTPATSYDWKTAGEETVYVNTNANGTIKIAVALNVIDDLVNRQYLGLKIKLDVDMATVA